MPAAGGAGESGGNAKVVYILYLVAVIVAPLAVIGVVIAHAARNDSGGWVNDHYRFQIRTFWIGLLYLAVGVAATSIVIGWLVLLAVLVWWIGRCVKGLRCASRSEPYPNPGTWLW